MDWITGERFISVANFVYTPEKRVKDDYNKSQNTLNLHQVRNGNVIYTHTMYVRQLFEILDLISGRVIVVTHNSDINVDNLFRVPKSVVKWYSQNVNVVDLRIESIPIGLENDRWFRGLKKKEKMLIKLTQPRRRKNLLYVNHNAKTNPAKREELYQLFADRSWVTIERGVNGIGFDTYLSNLYNHWFVLCPEGNGMDTHRTWETLYMGTIPIEKRNINNQFYKDLPICFVDSWEEVTSDFLETEYARIRESQWNMEKLTFEYWKNKILNTV